MKEEKQMLKTIGALCAPAQEAENLRAPRWRASSGAAPAPAVETLPGGPGGTTRPPRAEARRPRRRRWPAIWAGVPFPCRRAGRPDAQRARRVCGGGPPARRARPKQLPTGCRIEGAGTR